MFRHKIIIYSSSHIIRQGIAAIIKEETKNSLIVLEASNDQVALDYLEQATNIKAIFLEGDISSKALNKIFEIKSNRSDLQVIAIEPGWQHALKRHVKLISLREEKDELEKLIELITRSNKKGVADRKSGELSERERDVLKKVALGLTNKEISEQLYISMHTVITHRKNITHKLGIKTIPGLTVYAIINGIITFDEANK